MVRFAPFLILAAGLLARPALAQEDGGDTATGVSREYAVEGNTPQFCAVGRPALATTTPTNNVRDLTGNVVAIEQLADSTTMTTRAAEFGFELDAVCNTAHRLTLTSENNGLWREPETGAVPGGFAGAIPYQARMDWAGAQTTLTAAAESRREETQQALVTLPHIGAVVIDVSITAGATNRATNTPLLAGTYRDTLRVTIEPQ